MAAVDMFYAEHTARRLPDLKNTPEPGGSGSILNNTLVVYLSELGVGKTHDARNNPIVVFGGSRLGLKGRQFLQGDKRPINDMRLAFAALFPIVAVLGYAQLAAARHRRAHRQTGKDG